MMLIRKLVKLLVFPTISVMSNCINLKRLIKSSYIEDFI